MATAYVSGPKFVTPKGVAIWPRLNEADTKFNAAGTYECKVSLPADHPIVLKMRVEADKLIDAKFDEIMAANPSFLTEDAYDTKVEELKASGKVALIKKLEKLVRVDALDAEIDDEGDETGMVFLKAKMTASGVSKKTGKAWKRKPNIFDAQGTLIKNPPQIGGGSEVKMSIELNPYYAASDKKVGVSFRLEAVQVIKLVVFGQRDAAGYGFGEEEGDTMSECDAEFGAGSTDMGSSDDGGDGL